MILPKRKSTRLRGRDYHRDGLYFVTICTADRIEWFGQIRDGRMVLNGIGTIIADRWQWLSGQYGYVQLDSFVIMPNHLHGIAYINHPVGDGRDRPAGGSRPAPTRWKSLSGLVGAFKTTASKAIHRSGHPQFRWQRSFHDSIIRDSESLGRIRAYIIENPQNWHADDLNTGDPTTVSM